MRLICASVFFSLFTCLPAAFAETIQLKDGSVIRGSIATMDENVVTIDTADMGRVTIKRRNIQTIKDGVDTGSAGKSDVPSNMNININNQQTNDQKNDQKNDQVNNQKTDQKASVTSDDAFEPEPKMKDRVWHSGLFGRIGAGPRKIQISGMPTTHDELNKTVTKGIPAVDAIGYRFDGGWALALAFKGGKIADSKPRTQFLNTPSESADVDVIGGGLRVDLNLLQSSHGGKQLSQWFISPIVGTESLSVKNTEDRKENEESFRAEGTYYGLDFGYEYLFNSNFGVALSAAYSQSELKKFKFGHDAAVYGFESKDFTSTKIKVVSSAVLISLSWNADM